MISHVESVHHRLLQRRCVACGYDDGPLGHPRFEHCPHCGCDFAERPPRSYAEMEGLVGQPVTLHTPAHVNYRQQRLVHRWIAFSIFSVLLVLSLVYLAAAVLNPI